MVTWSPLGPDWLSQQQQQQQLQAPQQPQQLPQQPQRLQQQQLLLLHLPQQQKDVL